MYRFDCVYPTRTARFGVALVPAGTMRLKAKDYEAQYTPVDADCSCSTCKHYTRAFLHALFKENNPLAAQLLTKHNIVYMMRLMRSMRKAILAGEEALEHFIRSYLDTMFPAKDVPLWVVDALRVAGYEIETTVTSEQSEKGNGRREEEEGDAIGEE